MGKRFKFTRIALSLGAILFFLCVLFKETHPPRLSPENPIRFYSYLLRTDLKQLYLRAIREARHSIHLQIYELTDPDLIALLGRKWNEGCSVQVFCDAKGAKKVGSLFPVHPVKGGGLMHRKILVIDEEKSYLGSANFTPASLKIHGNLVLGLWGEEIARFFQKARFDEGLFTLGDTTLTAYLLPVAGLEAKRAILSRLSEAKKEIFVAMFTLTEPELVTSLCERAREGVRVVVALDRNAAQGASKEVVAELKGAGVELCLGRGPPLLHHKWALIDSQQFFFGSANWTRAAFTKNGEFLIELGELPNREKKILLRLAKTIESCAERE